MFINDFFKAGVTESKQAVSNYDTWRDTVAAAGGEIHPQRDRVHLVAQSWDGDIIGEFNLKTNQGWFGKKGVAEATGDEKFDTMMKKVAKTPTQAQRNAERIRQKREREEETRKHFANGGGFGPSPADKLSIRKGVAEDSVAEGENWSKHKNPRVGGMSKKSVSVYRREHPGSKIQTAVTTKPSKLKKGSKAAKRRKSFCARMSGNKGPMKKPNGKPTPKALALRRWNCESIEEMQQLVMIAEQQIHDMREAANAAQQAAIAINMKKHHKKPKSVEEAEGDPEGLPHLTKQLLQHIVQQVGREGAHAIIKSLEWGDGAADELLQLIVNDLKQDARGEVEETYGAQLHTKHKKNRFKQIKKIKQTQKKAFGLRSLEETGCNMTEEGRACPVHGIQECPGYGMTETSAQDKLHQHHQEIRKKSGLPHPDHYLKMMKQKQAEIDALKAEIAADKAKGLGEARKPDVNFDIEDIKKLERIRDLPTLKTLAFQMISKPSIKPMKPEKVEWFRSALERMDSPLKVIKLMYDLMLSGEGHQVIGSRNSMKANSYRGRFSEATVTPRFNGFQQTTDDDGTVTSDYSVGPVSASTTRRPNTINTTSATVPLAHNVQLTVDKGIGFGGAGKNVTQGGNQVSTITARTAQNPQGTTSSFAGRPTTQDLEKAIPKDWAPSDDEFSDDINETVERYVEELGRAGYDIVTESATACPECGGPAYSNSMLAEKQDACYHKVKSRYKVWPSAYASGALVRCRKVGANNWGNKSKK